MDGLVELLTVGGELLDAGLTLHVPQTDRTVVTWRKAAANQNEEQRSFISFIIMSLLRGICEGPSPWKHGLTTDVQPQGSV